MLLYLLFWTILGFIFHFYITFGTNLLTGGPAQNCCFFTFFSISKKQNIKRSLNRMKPSGSWFSNRTWSRRVGPCSKEQPRWSRGWGARPPPSACPLPRGPLLLHRRTPSPLYTYVPPADHPGSQKPNSTAATLCIHEIPSWGLFRCSAEGGIHHGGLLHQHHSLSDEVWVVYLRPTGP